MIHVPTVNLRLFAVADVHFIFHDRDEDDKDGDYHDVFPNFLVNYDDPEEIALFM